MADDKPIIIIKKKGGHGGHHGGAWKIAYADFVTAMMCFFMVMWLVNSAETSTKKSIATYFRRPGIFQQGSGSPLMMGESGILDAAAPPVGEEKGKKSPAINETSQFQKKSGTDAINEHKRVTYRGEEGLDRPLPEESENAGVNTDNPGDTLSRVDKKRMLEEIAEEIRQQIMAVPELAELLGIVDIKVQADGLNIEIMDTEKSSMFASGSARILPEAQEAFQKISSLLVKFNNKIDIVGHTDAKPFASRAGGYSNWELSSDRANAARRLLEQSGIAPEKITSVVGRADQELRNKDNPMDASNRRITLKMKFDFSKSVDLSKDPTALDKIPQYEAEHKAAQENKLRIEREKREEKVHSLTAKEIVESAKEKTVITLPEERNRLDRAPGGKDKIFGDSPVIGPPNIFNGL
ncbi:MAG: OmpA family protein [Deltaproteobacteria bacterium]|nr:OmpA family protein [Deltaproteobacteria bacterium]